MARSVARARKYLLKNDVGSDWGIPLLVLLITGVALALRAVDITSLPAGLHGDEAIVGLEGLRVLREGHIDPYSPSALGQPSGPFYLSAIFVELFGNTVLAVRLLAVILGTLTVPALYLAVRYSLGVPTALLSATFLAVMGWHIFYSRIAFPLVSWPLWVVLTAGAVAWAIQSRNLTWWAIAGLLAGTGIYTYNAHPLVLAIIVLFAVFALLSDWPISREAAKSGAIFVSATIAALIPMIWFAITNPDLYFSRFRGQSAAQRSEEWQQLDGSLDYARYITVEYVGYWRRLCCDPVRDSTDGSGVTETVPLLLMAVALAGLVIGVVRFRSPLVHLSAMIVLIMPLGAVLTEGAEMRRPFVIAPFLAMFAAVAVVEVIRLARERNARWLGGVAVAACAVFIGIGVTADLRNYYVTFAESDYQRWVFVESFADASLYMRDLDGDHYVYFYAERWSINYETRQFLAPDVRGEDRSEEFGQFSLEIDPDNGRPVFVLIGNYLPLLDEIEERYPDGEVITGGDGNPGFIAYEVPDNGRASEDE